MDKSSFFETLDKAYKKEGGYNKELLRHLINLSYEQIKHIPVQYLTCHKIWKELLATYPEEGMKILPRGFHEEILFWQTLLFDHPDVLEYAPYEIRTNHTLVYHALSSDPTVIRFAEKNAIVEILTMDSSYNQYLPDHYKDDEQIMAASVKRKGLNLQYASDRLKRHPQIVTYAIASNGLSLQYAHKEFRSNQDLVIQAGRQNPMAFAFMHSDLKTNKEFILRAIKTSTLALKFAMHLQDDELFLMKALEVNGLCLEYVSDRLKNQKQLVLKAINQNPRALRYASSMLKDDEEIVKEAVSKNGLSLAFASKRLKACEAIVLKAVNQNGLALQYADGELRKIKQIVIPACRKDGRALVFAHPQLKKMRAVVLSAVSQNGLALKHAFKDLKKYKEIILMAVSQNGGAIRFAHHELLNSDFFAQFAVLCNPRALSFVSSRFLNDTNLMLKVLKRDATLFDKMDLKLQYQEPFLIEAVNENPLVLDRICIRIKQKPSFLLKIKAVNALKQKLKDLLFSLENEDLKFFIIQKLVQAYKLQCMDFDRFNNAFFLCDLLHHVMHTISSSHAAACAQSSQFLSQKRLNVLFETKLKKHLCDEENFVSYARFFMKCERLNLSILKRWALYEAILKNSSDDQIIYLFTLTPIACFFIGFDKMHQLVNQNVNSIQDFVLGNFIQQNWLDPLNKDAFMKQLAKWRQPQSLLQYTQLFLTDPSLKKPLKHFCELIIEPSHESIYSQLDPEFKNLLTSNQVRLWEQENFSQYHNESCDLRNFFKEALIKQVADDIDHEMSFNEDVLCLEEFKKALLDPSYVSPVLADGSFQAKLTKLIDSDEISALRLIDDLIKNLEKSSLSSHEMYTYLTYLKTKLSYKVYVDVTKNPEDLFVAGTEVGGSCQRVDGDPHLNRCLMSYVFNPTLRLIAVRHYNRGPIKERAIIRLMKEGVGVNQRVVLLLEHLYPRKISKESEALIIAKAKMIADTMGLELYALRSEKKKEILSSCFSKQEMKQLVSSSTSLLYPYQYSSVGYGVTASSYAVNAFKVE